MGRKPRSLVIQGRKWSFNLPRDPYAAELKAKTQIQVHTWCLG